MGKGPLLLTGLKVQLCKIRQTPVPAVHRAGGYRSEGGGRKGLLLGFCQKFFFLKKKKKKKKKVRKMQLSRVMTLINLLRA